MNIDGCVLTEIEKCTPHFVSSEKAPPTIFLTKLGGGKVDEIFHACESDKNIQFVEHVFRI